METVGDRIKAFRESRGLTQKQIYQATKGAVKQTSLSAVEKNQAKPGFDTLAALLAAYPALRSDWLLRGEGVMLATGAPEDDYTPPTALRITASELPPPAPFSGELLDKLLNQINTAAQQHRDELAALKKEHKTALNLNVRMMQLAANVMASKIFDMEGRLGMRPLTAAEISAQQALEPPRAPKIGLKHYDESAPVGRYSVATAA